MPKDAVILEEGVWLVPRAHYEVDAYILAARKNRPTSRADVAAVDFALGWGVVVQPQNVHRVKITQAERHHEWEVADEVLLKQVGPRAYDISIATTHMIPATKRLRDLLQSASPGEAVRARGFLVDVRTRESTKYTRTSIKREDKGPGSGEQFYVTSAEILSTGY